MIPNSLGEKNSITWVQNSVFMKFSFFITSLSRQSFVDISFFGGGGWLYPQWAGHAGVKMFGVAPISNRTGPEFAKIAWMVHLRILKDSKRLGC